jgi:cytochrome c-type biogenesis protein CcmH
MLFSALLAVMTGVAVIAVLWPLSRPRVAVPAREADIAVYRDQLAEIERDAARDLIVGQEAESARIEVARRLLAAAKAAHDEAPAPGEQRRRRAAALLALVGIPLIAGGLYLSLGSPELPGAPLAARLAQPPEAQDLPMLVQRIEDHLARNPDDGRGWELLAPIYLRTGRFDAAVRARELALKLLGATAARETDLGEALVAEAQGRVSPEARDAFGRALAIDAQNLKALFFLGLAAEQDGKIAEAREMWTRLAAVAPEDNPWRIASQRRLERLGAGK